MVIYPNRQTFLVRVDNAIPHGGFPKLGVPYWGVLIIRTKVFWDLYQGPLILGNYHIRHRRTMCGKRHGIPYSEPLAANAKRYLKILLDHDGSSRKEGDPNIDIQIQ